MSEKIRLSVAEHSRRAIDTYLKNNEYEGLPQSASMRTIMHAQAGKQESVGTLRRYVLNLSSGQLREEVIGSESYEFPVLAAARSLRRHRPMVIRVR